MLPPSASLFLGINKAKEKKMSKVSSLIKTPAASTVNATRTALESATLETIAACAIDAGVTIKGLAGATSAVKAGVTRAVLRVVSAAPISAVVGPLKATIEGAPACLAQLSTIRTAIVKMAVCYGEGLPASNMRFRDADSADGLHTPNPALPIWLSTTDASESGDAAQTAAIDACLRTAADGSVTLDSGARDELLARLVTACGSFALSEKSIGRIRSGYIEQLQGAIADAADALETAKLTDAEKLQKESDAAIVKDAKAQEVAELVTLRAIAEQARRLIGCSANASMAELLADLSNTDSDNETETEAETTTAE